MDEQRFDELSKLLGTKLTRSRFFNVLSALSVSGLTLSADPVLGESEIRMLKKKVVKAAMVAKAARRRRGNAEIDAMTARRTGRTSSVTVLRD